jgi:hypothetical protein
LLRLRFISLMSSAFKRQKIKTVAKWEDTIILWHDYLNIVHYMIMAWKTSKPPLSNGLRQQKNCCKQCFLCCPWLGHTPRTYGWDSYWGHE